MDYFSDFPTIQYPFIGKIVGGDNVPIQYETVLDIMVRFKAVEKALTTPLSYFTYEWKDNDRPDTVAEWYYGDPSFAWLVMLSAQVFDALYEFPMPSDEFYDYIVSTYGSWATANTTIHHYVDGDGDIIDVTTYNNISDPGKAIISCLEYEETNNENRRNIKLLNRKFLPEIVDEFESMLLTIQENRATLAADQIMET